MALTEINNSDASSNARSHLVRHFWGLSYKKVCFKRPKVLVIVRVWDVSQQCETSQTLNLRFRRPKLWDVWNVFSYRRELWAISIFQYPTSRTKSPSSSLFFAPELGQIVMRPLSEYDVSLISNRMNEVCRVLSPFTNDTRHLSPSIHQLGSFNCVSSAGEIGSWISAFKEQSRVWGVHCGASTESWCFVKHFWHVPPAVGLILQILCRPIWNLKFQKKMKPNMTTERMPQSV